jgi:hypothetical protein
MNPAYGILGHAETSAHGTLVTETNRKQSAMSFFLWPVSSPGKNMRKSCHGSREQTVLFFHRVIQGTRMVAFTRKKHHLCPECFTLEARAFLVLSLRKHSPEKTKEGEITKHNAMGC